MESSSNYIYHIIKKKVQFKYELIVHGIGIEIFREKGIKINYITSGDKNLEKMIKKINPELIFLVPQYKYNLEKKCMHIGNKLGIKIIAAIDHWFPLNERFEYEKAYNGRVSKHLLSPNYIIVNDRYIKSILDDRFPKKNIKVFGNPILQNRWHRINIHKLKLKFLRRNYLKPVIIFISEPYSEIDYKYKKKMNPGFSEKSIVRNIISILKEDYHLIIKLHPSESKNKFNNYLSKNKNVSIIGRENIDDILIFAEKIIGMGSLVLIESSLIRSDVISYRPDEKYPFYGNTIHKTKLCKNVNELKKEIKIRKKTKSFKQTNTKIIKR